MHVFVSCWHTHTNIYNLCTNIDDVALQILRKKNIMHMVEHRGIRDLRHLVSLSVVSNICSMSGDKRHLLFSLQGKIY